MSRPNAHYRTADTAFEIAETDADRYNRDTQLTALAVAVEEHTHDDERGLPVKRLDEGALTGSMVGDAQISDAKIGNRTIDQSQVPAGNTGFLTQIVSWFANRIVAITGKANWYDNPDVTLNALSVHAQTRHAPAGPDPLNLAAYNVWTSLNDGAGSGLDADRVAGRKISVQSTAPVSPTAGDIWIDTSG